MVDRRHFLKGAAASTVAAAATALPRASHAAGTPRKQPNLVVIVADDLRWDSIGALGNRIAQTPAIDRLARHGRLFPNTFVTTSICPTSRASIFTGQYARRHGIWSFDKPLNAAQMQQTYPAVLRAHGYQTGFVGKWGLGG